MKKKILSLMAVLILVAGLAASLSGCGAPDNPNITLATTTSTKDSGLLDYLLPIFEEETGYKVEVVSVGSGEAIALGEQRGRAIAGRSRRRRNRRPSRPPRRGARPRA